MKALVVAQPSSIRSARDLTGAAKALGANVTAILLGEQEGAQELVDAGAAEVLWSDDPALAASPAEAGLVLLQHVCERVRPDLILFNADSSGRDWAPRLAFRLDAGLVTECVGWEAQDAGRLHFHRPVYGGKALATIVSTRPVQIAVVQPGALPQAAAADAPSGTIASLDFAIAVDPAWPVVKERVSEAGSGPALDSAATVISGGRGIGSGENFKIVRELADVLGAAVGASRAAVDEGWAPASWQVGQTGKSVRPNLYLAIGISGASQHVAGITAAKNVVAINTNAAAPIFKVARLGVVGDYTKVVPPLVEILRVMRSQ